MALGTNDGNQTPRVSSNEGSSRNSISNLSVSLSKIKKENEMLKINEEKLAELFEAFNSEQEELQRRRSSLLKSAEMIAKRELLLKEQAKVLQKTAEKLRSEEILLDQLQKQQKAKLKRISELEQELCSKGQRVSRKRAQLLEREKENQDFQKKHRQVLEEKFSHKLGRIISDATEATEIRQVYQQMPLEKFRMSMLVQPHLESMMLEKEQVLKKYGLETDPMNVKLKRLVYFSNELDRLKKIQVGIFNEIKKLQGQL